MTTSPKRLIFSNHNITYLAPEQNVTVNNEIAIIIHLFYLDIWREISEYLLGIDKTFDLYITMPENASEESILTVFNTHPNATIYLVENRGRDVLPFLSVVSSINIESYKYICKIHTKKTGDSALGNVWRKLLYYDLIGSNETVANIIHTFEHNHNVGIVTGKNTILDSKRYTYGNNEGIEYLASLTNIIYDDYYLFPAGTMFWIRPEIIMPIVNEFKKGNLAFEIEAGQADNTLAHAIERFFGIIAQAKNMQIVESPSKYSQLSDDTLNEVAKLVLSQQYVGNNVFAAQKMKIEAQYKHIDYLEELADSMRIKNRLKSLVSDKIIPMIDKIKKLPKKVISLIKVLKNNPSLMKKVFYYAKKGELKYLFTKIKEKSNNNLRETDALPEVVLKNYFLPFDKEKYTLHDITIDIIIPVYNGYEFLEKLFDSIKANTTSDYRLIVVNDCSPDERVKPYLLKRLEDHPSSIFIDHKENQGFLKSVNEAYTYVSNHFLLLNTDTEVPPFWMERLMYPIIHMDKVASTTPFTNSGEIASFPNFVADNEIFDGMSVDALDSIFQEVNPTHFYAEVPTGVGFCMGVNYHLAQEMGMFVEDTFGKGYGEENDWCQRAIQKGYKNFIVPNLFVYHKHGGSFSAEEKQALLQKNAVKLLERHPNYGKDVNRYIEENPHDLLRNLLVLKASDSTVGTEIVFDHNLGGGANIYADTYIQEKREEKRNILLIQYDFYSHVFKISHTYKSYSFSFKMSSFEELTKLIESLHINHIFLNNLVSYKAPENILSYITTLVDEKNIHLTIPIHDFYALCPSYNLLNEKGQYCEVPSLEQCKVCMSKNMQEWRNFYDQEVDMSLWREKWHTLLVKSSEILCFSHSSKEIFMRAYPHIDKTKILVTPHKVTDIEPLQIAVNNSTTMTIGVLGAISYVKGAHVIRQLIQTIEKDALDINVVIIGELTESIQSKHLHVTGKYEREDLPNIIKEHQIDTFLIPSIWPETFSYTSQEIMMMELPLMVFDLGAPAERVKKYEKGYIVPEIHAKSILDTLNKIGI